MSTQPTQDGGNSGNGMAKTHSTTSKTRKSLTPEVKTKKLPTFKQRRRLAQKANNGNSFTLQT
jgi:hypothetical protein